MRFAQVARREFIALLGGATAAWPLAARAQQRGKPIIGYLSSISRAPASFMLGAFRQGLADLGFVEDRNVTIIYRYADGQYDRLQALASELVAQQVDVIVTGPSSPAALAAKRATSTIPIVFELGADPIGLGLVASYNRPDANLTGINVSPESLTAKRLELLDDLVPNGLPIAELVNLSNKTVDTEERVAKEAARMLGRELLFVAVANDGEVAPAFEEMAQKHVGGLIIWLEAFLQSQREQIVSLANKHRIPTVCPTREFSEVGGLISYGPNLSVTNRQVGAYVGRILKGARPADLPVMTPTAFDLIINMKTAKALSLAIPPTLLAIANEVIE
jgi:putative tryptophan/tyrosine transport system substrate-binding protein